MGMIDKVVDTIKDGLGDLEVEAINRLVADSAELKDVKETLAEKDSRIAELDGILEKVRHELEMSKREALHEIAKSTELKGQLETYKEREVEFRVMQRMVNIHDKYAGRSMDILDNSLRQYTQKTTRHIALEGGDIPTYDNNGQPVMQKMGSHVEQVKDKTELE